jgi:hypothetical protein
MSTEFQADFDTTGILTYYLECLARLIRSKYEVGLFFCGGHSLELVTASPLYMYYFILEVHRENVFFDDFFEFMMLLNSPYS